MNCVQVLRSLHNFTRSVYAGGVMRERCCPHRLEYGAYLLYVCRADFNAVSIK
jgi:hypothetical protein